jgi:hypothetical protein
MEQRPNAVDRKMEIDSKLTELALYAKELCPGAEVETTPLQYEDEDGHVEVFPPTSLSDAEVDRLELALAARAAQIFAETDLYILCAVLDRAAR